MRVAISNSKPFIHAIGLCKEYVNNEPFIVYLGDNRLKEGIKDFAESFQNSNYDAIILLSNVENPQRLGVAKLNGKGNLTGLVEKPKQPPSNYALTGIYFLKSIIFEMIKNLKPSWRGEFEITEAIQLLLDNGYTVGHQFVNGWWKDTGAPEDILDRSTQTKESSTASSHPTPKSSPAEKTPAEEDSFLARDPTLSCRSSQISIALGTKHLDGGFFGRGVKEVD